MAKTIADLVIKINGDSKQLQKELSASQRQIKRAFGPETMKMSDSALKGIGLLSAGISAAAAAAVKLASDFATTRHQFTTLTGDIDTAKKLLNDIWEWSKNSPFDVKKIEKYSQSMLTVGYSAQDILPILQQVGDWAAASGKGEAGMDSMVASLNKIQASGELTAKDLKALNNLGIGATEAIAEYLGTNMTAVTQMAKDGAISSTDAINAVVNSMQNKFAGGMANTQKEVSGMIGTIQHNLGLALVNLGTSLDGNNKIKDFLQGIVDWTDKLSTKLKTAGIAEAFRDLVPPEVQAAIFAIAGAILTMAAPAFAVWAIGAIKATVAMLPILTIGAAIGAIAYVIWKAWAPLSDAFSALMSKIGSYIERGMLIAVGIAQHYALAILTVIKIVSDRIGGSFSEAINKGLENVKSAIATTTKDFQASAARGEEAGKKLGDALSRAGNEIMGSVPSVSSLGDAVEKVKTKFSALDPASQKASGNIHKVKDESEKLNRELSRISEKLTDLTNKAGKMAEEFRAVKFDVHFQGATGGERVYAEIEKEREARQKALKDQVEKQADAVREAEALRKSALKTGNDEAIAETTRFLNTRLAEEKRVREEAAAYSAMIDQQQKDKALETATAIKAIKEELDSAYNQGNLEKYIATLDENRAAFIADMEARQEIMDIHKEVMLASQMSATQLLADMYGAAFNGLSGALSDIFTGVKSASEAFQALGKSMLKVVADFLAKWLAARITQAIFGKVLMQQENAMITAQAALATSVWSTPAWLKLVVDPSAAGIATIALSAGMTAAAGLSQGLGLIGDQGGTGVQGTKTLTEGKNFNPLAIPKLKMANGGIAIGETYAMIGEGKYKEAVIPLYPGALNNYIDMPDVGSGGFDITLINNGDINSGHDLKDLMDEFSNAVWAGVRNI